MSEVLVEAEKKL